MSSIIGFRGANANIKSHNKFTKNSSIFLVDDKDHLDKILFSLKIAAYFAITLEFWKKAIHEGLEYNNPSAINSCIEFFEIRFDCDNYKDLQIKSEGHYKNLSGLKSYNYYKCSKIKQNITKNATLPLKINENFFKNIIQLENVDNFPFFYNDLKHEKPSSQTAIVAIEKICEQIILDNMKEISNTIRRV